MKEMIVLVLHVKGTGLYPKSHPGEDWFDSQTP